MTLDEASQIINLYNHHIDNGAAWLDNPMISTQPEYESSFGVMFESSAIPTTIFSLGLNYYIMRANEQLNMKGGDNRWISALTQQESLNYITVLLPDIKATQK